MIKSRFIQSLFLLIPVMVHFNSGAQITSGSVCPDFTTTDLTNEEFNLYNELDEGKTVIIHVFAAWSPISWDYHLLGSLQNLYNTGGPGGDNSVSVLMVEGEPDNQPEQITGTGTSGVLYSAGDWTSGTGFPICDDAALANQLQVSYFPTVYMICPDRRIFEIGAISEDEIMAFIEQQGCSPVTVNRDLALIAINRVDGDCENPEYAFEAIIQNKGLETITSTTISAIDWFDYNWEGVLETYGFDTVSIGSINFPIGDTVLFLLSTPDDTGLSNDSIEKYVGTVAASTHIRIQIRTDNWPSETSWVIRDQVGNAVAESESYATMTNQTITRDVYLQSTGCFNFTLFDSGNDGLNGSEWGATDGFCRVYGVDANGLPLRFIYDYNGNYNLTEETSDFLVNEVVGIQERQNVGNLRVYPNPTSEFLNIDYSLINAESLQFNLFNSLGTLVYSDFKGVQPAGKYVGQIDVNKWSAGFYLLQISNADGIIATLRVNISR